MFVYSPRLARHKPPPGFLCTACAGSGKHRLADTGGRPAPCPRCRGTGSEPTPHSGALDESENRDYVLGAERRSGERNSR